MNSTMLLIVFLIGSAFASTDPVYNEIVDAIFYGASQAAVEYNLDKIPLPDESVTFDKTKVGIWTLTGYVNASGGNTWNTTSISRVGDVDIEMVDDKAIISLSISFSDMEAHFDVFNFNLGLPSSTGGLDLKVGQNEVLANFTLEKNDNVCKITLNKVSLTKLGGISISLLPPGIWNTVKNKVYNLYANHHANDFEDVINEHLQDIVEIVLDKIDLCHYLPF